MARICDICGKGPLRGYNVSHAHNRTKKIALPNLQTIRVLQPDGKSVKRATVCTRCIRSNKISKAP